MRAPGKEKRNGEVAGTAWEEPNLLKKWRRRTKKGLLQVDIFLPVIHNKHTAKGLLTLGTHVQAEQVVGWKRNVFCFGVHQEFDRGSGIERVRHGRPEAN